MQAYKFLLDLGGVKISKTKGLVSLCTFSPQGEFASKLFSDVGFIGPFPTGAISRSNPIDGLVNSAVWALMNIFSCER
jgi:hypothetical protein